VRTFGSFTAGPLAAGLQPVDEADRIRRLKESRPRPTHCKHGHEFTPENTIEFKNGKRKCRTCRNEYDRRRRRERATEVTCLDCGDTRTVTRPSPSGLCATCSNRPERDALHAGWTHLTPQQARTLAQAIVRQFGVE
jgi:hypothetical protein